MNITTNGVELNDEELIQFFSDHCEVSTIVLHDSVGMVVGDVIAITNDNRLVLDIDLPVTCNLFSDKFCNVRVVVCGENNYILTIIE